MSGWLNHRSRRVVAPLDESECPLPTSSPLPNACALFALGATACRCSCRAAAAAARAAAPQRRSAPLCLCVASAARRRPPPRAGAAARGGRGGAVVSAGRRLERRLGGRGASHQHCAGEPGGSFRGHLLGRQAVRTLLCVGNRGARALLRCDAPRAGLPEPDARFESGVERGCGADARRVRPARGAQPTCRCCTCTKRWAGGGAATT